MIAQLLRSRAALTILAVALTLVVLELLNDEVRRFWDENSLTTSLVTGTLMVVGAYFVFERLLNAREMKLMESVHHETKRTVEEYAKEVRELLNAFKNALSSAPADAGELHAAIDAIVDIKQRGDTLLLLSVDLRRAELTSVREGLANLQLGLRHLQLRFGDDAESQLTWVGRAREAARRLEPDESIQGLPEAITDR